MRFAATLTSLSVLGLALAQNNSTNATNVVTIQVGSTANAPGGIFQFIPTTVNATKGTVINFKYAGMPGNHSVTQSTFDNPCVPMDGGFDSGNVFIPNPGETPVPEWNLTITDDTKPIWFFCKALIPSPHCPMGMVGAINPPTSGPNTYANYKQSASNVKNVPQVVNGLVGAGGSASARPGPLPSNGQLFPPAGASGSASGSGAAPPSPSSTGGTSGALDLTVSSAVLAVMAAMTGALLA